MGILNWLRGIPDETGRPGPTAAAHARADFDLGSLPAPDARVRDAVERGQRLVAIKAYREQVDVGLAEAKALIDAIARGDRIVGAGAPTERVTLVSKPVDEEVDRLIAAGQLIAAIKVHRQAHGTGLKESKDAVDARRDQLRLG